MKILQVIHSFPPYNTAGSEVYTYNLSRELAKRHKVFVFHRINDPYKKEYELTNSPYDGLLIYTINNTFRHCDSFEMTYKNNIIGEKFGLILDQIKPDIVHIQHLLYLSAKIIEEIKKRKIPMVFTLHDYWLICPQGQLFKNNIKLCNREDNSECINCILHHLSIKKHIFNTYCLLKKTIPECLFQVIKSIYLTYSKFVFLNKDKALFLIEERIAYIKDICSKIDLLISPSQLLKRKFIKFGIPEDKITLLSYGFDLDFFKNLQKIPSDKLRFGFIGNLLPAKGVHILIQTFNKIRNDNVELRIYGRVSSYKGTLGNYLRYLKKVTGSKNIKFMGGFACERIAETFSDIDVLVVPSIWYENSPLVIQEAFLSKTPVIASRIGGIPELISDGASGLLFNPGDVNDLQEKIQYLIDNPDIIEKLKENMPEVKSIEDNAKEIEEIYGKLVA